MRKPLLLLALASGSVVAAPLLPPRLEPLPEPRFLPDQPADSGGLQTPTPGAKSVPPTTPSGYGAISIRSFRIQGVTVFSEETIKQVTAPFTGRGLTPEDLEELRDRLTRLYVEDGYINSGAVLESIDAEQGVVTFRVVEGTLTDIRVDGTGRLNPAYVSDRLRLSAGPPLNTRQLQDGFRLLLQDPMIEQLNGALAPGRKPGEAVLDLKAQTARPYDLRLGLDNHKPVSTGEFQGTLDGTLRNLTGEGDALSISLAGSEGYLQGRASFELPATPQDTRVKLTLEQSRSEVTESPLDELDIVGRSKKASLGVTHPLVNRLTQTLMLGAELSLESSRNELLGEPFSFTRGEEDGRSKVASLDFSQTYTKRAENLAWSAQSVFTIGLNALGATNHDGDLPDGQFLSWLGRFQYARRLPQIGGQALFRGDLQLTSDELLPLSRFSLGGATTVRGYRENRLTGDAGYIASLEYRHPIRLGEINDSVRGLSGLAFVDTGAAWDKGTDDRDTITSAGLGLRWEPNSHIRMELDWAHPFNTASTTDGNAWQDEGVHFRLTWEL